MRTTHHTKTYFVFRPDGSTVLKSRVRINRLTKWMTKWTILSTDWLTVTGFLRYSLSGRLLRALDIRMYGSATHKGAVCSILYAYASGQAPISIVVIDPRAQTFLIRISYIRGEFFYCFCAFYNTFKNRRWFPHFA